MRDRKSKYKRGIILMLMIFSISISSYGQYQPLIAQYYQNRYLSNSAMAGIEKGNVFNASYRGQLSSIEGSPENQVLSGSFRVKEKIGLGFQLSNVSAGLLGSMIGKVSYAYHLPLGDVDHELHMGVSAGFQKDRFNQSGIAGSTGTDPMIGQYNDQGVAFQGDLGLGYSYKQLSLQLSLPNLGRLLSKGGEQAGTPNYYGAASYKLDSKGGISIEPMVSVLGSQTGNTLLGIGTRAGILEDKLQLTGFYHSNSTFAAALGYQVSERVQFMGAYNVSGQQVQGYVNGSFELGLAIDLKKKAQ
jgi:type IX secretion system PorP/SprF family membrane protein